jgi:hypothetical protein
MACCVWQPTISASCICPICVATPGNSAPSSPSREEYRRRSQASLRLLRELLRRDYAIGYLLLGWMLQTTWSVAPAIAMLLGLPQPDARTAEAQLPALITWMLTGSSRSNRRTIAVGNTAAAAAAADAEEDEDEKMLLQLLSAGELQQLQEQLVGPAAALASLASFMKAHQALSGAPATAKQVITARIYHYVNLGTFQQGKLARSAQYLHCEKNRALTVMHLAADLVCTLQVLEFMQKEQQLMELFQGTNLADNLAAATTAVAATAQLSATQSNAEKAASALAVLAQLSATQSNTTAASSAAAVLGQLAATHSNAAAASSAAAALGQLAATQQNAAAASSAAAAMAQLGDVAHQSSSAAAVIDSTSAVGAATEQHIPQPAAPAHPVEVMVAGATSAAADAAATAADALFDSAVPGFGSVLVDLASKVSKAVQQVMPQLSIDFSFGGSSSSNSQAAAAAAEGLLLDPAAVLAQLQALQQRLPTKQDKAAMLQEYQAWLDSVKECLVQQHEQTQVRPRLMVVSGGICERL